MSIADVEPSTKCISKMPLSFFLPLELQLPGEDPGNDCRQGENRRARQIVISRLQEAALLGFLREKIKHHPGNKQREGKCISTTCCACLASNAAWMSKGFPCRPPFAGDHCTTTFPVILGWIEQK